jgi:hypothetical protein
VLNNDIVYNHRTSHEVMRSRVTNEFKRMAKRIASAGRFAICIE